nr:SpoIIE family protein phosphatase [Candidatus Kapabacteria bacterium]
LVFRMHRTVEQKRQSRPIAWMFFLVLSGAIANTILINMLESVTPRIGIHISILLIPTVYLYVIGRYHLLDLEIRVKRNIQYFMISLFRRLFMLTVLGFSAWGILNITFAIPNLHMTGTSIELLDNALSEYKHDIYEKIAVLLLVGFAVITIFYINKALKKLLDTKYYRTRFDYRRASKELSEILAKALTVDDLARYIANESGELIHLKRAGVIFFKDEAKVCGQDYYGVQSATLVEYCNYAGKSIADAVKKFRGEFSVDYLPDMMKDIFLNCGFKHVIPIRSKDKVMGALFVGEKKSEVSFTQEDIEFISLIAGQAAVAIENAFLIDNLAHQERMKHELSIAREIQMASLPEDLPSVKGLDISGLSLPAMEVGGDFYDFLNSENENEITVIVGDVSGKGTSAALYMSKTQGILRTLHEFKMSPHELFARTNRLLYKYLGKTSFVTAVGASIDIQSKTITMARAGHEPIFYYNSTGKRIERLVPKGIVLGVSKTDLFKNNLEEINMTYNSGDVFLFVTDGVLEARNSREVDFDEERLLNIFAKSVYSDAEKIRDNIVEAVQEFAGDEDQFDDITVVVVKAK